MTTNQHVAVTSVVSYAVRIAVSSAILIAFYLTRGLGSIVDNFAPHAWSGKNGVTQYFADFGAWGEANDATAMSIALDRPLHVFVEGDHGYAVIPATFNYKAKGATVQEPGLFTFAMRKTGGSWKIAAWTWSTK